MLYLMPAASVHSSRSLTLLHSCMFWSLSCWWFVFCYLYEASSGVHQSHNSLCSWRCPNSTVTAHSLDRGLHKAKWQHQRPLPWWLRLLSSWKGFFPDVDSYLKDHIHSSHTIFPNWQKKIKSWAIPAIILLLLTCKLITARHCMLTDAKLGRYFSLSVYNLDTSLEESPESCSQVGLSCCQREVVPNAQKLSEIAH